MSTPQGFRDTDDPRDLAIFNRIRTTVAECFDLAGYDEIRTPAVEFSNRIGKHILEDGLPDNGMFSFKDAKDKWLSLRYDHTAPLARYVDANRKSLQFPFNVWRQGWVWRNEMNIRAGRFREFYQMDADIVGSSNVDADAAVIRLLLRIFKQLGLDITLRYSSRKLIDETLDKAGIDGNEQRLQIMRALDKADRVGFEAAGEEIKKIAPAAAEMLTAFLKGSGWAYAGTTAVAELRDRLGDCPQARFYPLLVRGMQYYTGLVFEVAVNGREDYGSVAGGGRYDNLIKGVPCVGTSIGVSRLAAAMRAIEGDSTDAPIGPVMVYVMDDQSGRAADFAETLQAAGIRAEAWCGQSKKLTRAMAYADRRNAPAAVIQGADEASAGTLQIKDLVLGRRLAENVKDNAEWRAERPGQQEVPVQDLVAAVRQIIEGESQ